MTIKEMANKIKDGDKRALAKAMTLVCSHLESDKEKTRQLIPLILQNSSPSYRIGVSGIGGVGKSTFIEALGTHIISEQSDIKLGIITVDPSSPESGGSILADSVRMRELVASERVFLRAVSNQTLLGGLNQEAHEMILLLEGAGCDFVIIESVGSGQSDDRISLLSDLTLLLQMPASGDNMQALKKGSIETSDFIVVNKNDGILSKEAKKTALLYKQREQLLHTTSGHEETPVFLVSSLEKTGLKELWKSIEQVIRKQGVEETLPQKRALQLESLLKEQVVQEFMLELENNELIKEKISKTQKELKERKSSPLLAARGIIKSLF